MATVGTIVDYHFYATDSLLSERMTILDRLTGKRETFSLSYVTRVDGAPLRCAPTTSPTDAWGLQEYIREYGLCRQLPPPFVVGKTKVLLIYWKPFIGPKPINLIRLIDAEPSTDAIWIIPPAMPAPQ